MVYQDVICDWAAWNHVSMFGLSVTDIMHRDWAWNGWLVCMTASSSVIEFPSTPKKSNVQLLNCIHISWALLSLSFSLSLVKISCWTLETESKHSSPLLLGKVGLESKSCMGLLFWPVLSLHWTKLILALLAQIKIHSANGQSAVCMHLSSHHLWWGHPRAETCLESTHILPPQHCTL